MFKPVYNMTLYNQEREKQCKSSTKSTSTKYHQPKAKNSDQVDKVEIYITLKPTKKPYARPTNEENLDLLNTQDIWKSDIFSFSIKHFPFRIL